MSRKSPVPKTGNRISIWARLPYLHRPRGAASEGGKAGHAFQMRGGDGAHLCSLPGLEPGFLASGPVFLCAPH